MTRLRLHSERHLVSRVGWLRAAVLGANDGIVSTASLIIGVAAASVPSGNIIVVGAAGLVAGAMSMAAGEYVSVSSQADTEHSDLARERAELDAGGTAELEELAAIYVARGLDAATAGEVARQFMAKDALGAHARDELGITDASLARPIQAALTSAAAFTFGAALPLLTVLFSPPALLLPAIIGTSLVFLALLGGIGGVVGGAPIWRATARVTGWGAVAMALTFAVGRLVGTSV